MKDMNVKNIPLNNLYQFDKNRYVWKINLNSTRNGNYNQGSLITLTEVYEQNVNGELDLVVSGRLIENDDVYKDYQDFSIFDYDKDTSYSFKTTMELKPASLDIMYKLRSCISRIYQNKHK